MSTPKGFIWGKPYMPGNKLPNLRGVRESRGVSRRRLSDISGYSYQHLGNLERCYKGASSDCVQDLADSLGVDKAALL